MEFFRVVDIQADENQIQDQINLDRIEEYCENMFVLEPGNSSSKCGTIWGEFDVSCHKIMGGVRFTLLDCPNALAWTLTTGYPPARDKVVLHATINRERKHEEFVEEIHEFLDDWEKGLIESFKKQGAIKFK